MYSHLRPHLIRLTETSPDIEASILVSVDGLVMESTLPFRGKTELNIECLGAICAGAVMLGEHAAERCASGSLEQVLIRCADNQILMTHVGEEAILAVLTKHEANLELVFFNIKHVADNIMRAIKPTAMTVTPDNVREINKTAYHYSEQKQLVPCSVSNVLVA